MFIRAKVFQILLCFAALVSPVYADEIPAQDIRIFTPTYQPAFEDFDPPLGDYEYQVSWQGVPAAQVNVQVQRVGARYKVSTTAKTYSPIDLFYKLRYRAEGVISALDFKPIKTVIDHRENSRHRVTRITFDGDGEIHAVRYRKGHETEELNFNSNNFTLDPFSAAFIARGIKWELGQEKQFDTFNGKSRYLITLKAVDKSFFPIKGEMREAWKIVPTIKNLTNPDKNSKFRSATIYLSTDKSREILKIKSSVFVGSVSTTLVDFKEYDNPKALNFLSAKRTRKDKKNS